MTDQKAKEFVFRLLKNRHHSEKEIRDKLEKRKFNTSVIEETIGYFKKITLIDDRTFTKHWIASRLAKPFGMNRIQFELETKGISKKIFEEEKQNTLAQYKEDEIVTRLAKRQREKYSHIDRMKIKQRVYGYLSRRGFNSQAITKAINELR